jgi:hypothetical protein
MQLLPALFASGALEAGRPAVFARTATKPLYLPPNSCCRTLVLELVLKGTGNTVQVAVAQLCICRHALRQPRLLRGSPPLVILVRILVMMLRGVGRGVVQTPRLSRLAYSWNAAGASEMFRERVGARGPVSLCVLPEVFGAPGRLFARASCQFVLLDPLQLGSAPGGTRIAGKLGQLHQLGGLRGVCGVTCRVHSPARRHLK